MDYYSAVVYCTGIPGWWDMQSEEYARVDGTDDTSLTCYYADICANTGAYSESYFPGRVRSSGYSSRMCIYVYETFTYAGRTR